MSSFSILSRVDFQLCHSAPGDTKKIRFICLKGALEGSYPSAADPTAKNDLRIRFWKDEAEFEAHAANHKPIGWEAVPHAKPARQAYQTPAARLDQRINQDVRSFYGRQQAELQVASKGKLLKLQNASEPEPNSLRVYILKSAEGNDDVYVGQSPCPNHRLRKHNRQIKGGAAGTEGQQWEIVALYRGFVDMTHCLSFESTLQKNPVSHYSEMVVHAASLMKMHAHKFVTRDTEHYSFQQSESRGSHSSRERSRTPVPAL